MFHFKNLFSAKGRIDRTAYFIHSIADLLFVMVFLFLVSFVDAALGTESNPDTIVAILFFVILTGAIAEIFASIKRFHDLGKPAWHFLLFMIPIYNIYLGLLLLLQKGEPEANEYGPPPLRRGS